MKVNIRHFAILIAFVVAFNQSYAQKEYSKPDSGLTEFPREVLAMKDVEVIFLRCQWVALPPIEGAGVLIGANANSISVIPDEIGNLRKLKKLFLGCNHLTRFPETMANLRELEMLEIDYNYGFDVNNFIQTINSIPSLKSVSAVGMFTPEQQKKILESLNNKKLEIIFEQDWTPTSPSL